MVLILSLKFRDKLKLWRFVVNKARFTPQIGFIARIRFLFFLCGQYEILVSNGHGPELTHIPKRCKSSMGVKMDATEVRVYMYKLMHTVSQQIHEQMITRMRRRTAAIIAFFFVEQWLLILYGGVCGCRVEIRN